MLQVPGPYILLADDDDEDQEFLKEALSRQAPGIGIESVWDGEEVLSYLRDRADDALPGLIILDYKMPVLNGAEVLDRLRQDSRFASIPKVVWSTSSQQEYIDDCLEKGALHFFTKPNTPADLQIMTKKILLLFQ